MSSGVFDERSMNRSYNVTAKVPASPTMKLFLNTLTEAKEDDEASPPPADNDGGGEGDESAQGAPGDAKGGDQPSDQQVDMRPSLDARIDAEFDKFLAESSGANEQFVSNEAYRRMSNMVMEGKSQLNLEAYAGDVANLAKHFMDLIDVTTIIVLRAKAALAASHGQAAGEELMEILETQHGVTPDETQHEVESNERVAPLAVGAGPFGA